MRGHHLARLTAIGALALSILAVPLPAAAAQTWTITTGGTPDDSIQAYLFGPGKITIDQGDTITWHQTSNEPHTISFGFDQPLLPVDPKATQPIGSGNTFDGSTQISSGLVGKLFGSPDYSLTFTAAPGAYTYFCFIHPGMVGQVVVQAPGTAYPQTQDQVTADGQSQINSAIAATQALVDQAKVTTAAGPAGSTVWTVPTSVGSGNAASERFLGGDLTIKVGDTVTWADSDPVTPHTATFGTPPPGPPDVAAFTPAPGSTYDGTGYRNQIFGPAAFGLPSSYSLTFTKPGTYQYQCLLHADLGMVGTITVVAGAAVQAPVQAPLPGASG